MTNGQNVINTVDPEIARWLGCEYQRQKEHIELIASENYASPAVMAAQGSVLTNKYAEGYPGRRYYGGCCFVDEIESLAIDRAKKLFGAEYVNVQPHSGSQANAAVMMKFLQAGDTILGMDLSQGGHLTHGCKVNFSGQLYQSVAYGLNDQGCIDYDQLRDQAKKHNPKLIIAGFSAYSGMIDWSIFREVADEVGAYLLADMAHVAGLVAAKLYPSPLPYADFVTTTTHKTLRGPRGGLILAASPTPEVVKKLNSAIFPMSQGGPLMHVIAAKAVAFQEAMHPAFCDYQKSVLANIKAMVSTLQDGGVAVVGGQTHNHLALLDLRDRDYSGQQAEQALEQAHITLNKNSVPNDPRPPMATSGLRIGTPAVTTRGFDEPACVEVARAMVEVLDHLHDPTVLASVRDQMISLCKRFPIYNQSIE